MGIAGGDVVNRPYDAETLVRHVLDTIAGMSS